MIKSGNYWQAFRHPDIKIHNRLELTTNSTSITVKIRKRDEKAFSLSKATGFNYRSIKYSTNNSLSMPPILLHLTQLDCCEEIANIDKDLIDILSTICDISLEFSFNGRSEGVINAS